MVFGHYLEIILRPLASDFYLTHQGGGGGVAASSGATSSWHSANNNRFIICGFGFDCDIMAFCKRFIFVVIQFDGFTQNLMMMSLMTQMMDQKEGKRERDLKGVTALV